MRPTPHHGRDYEETGRIISLGDVRRRRAGRPRAPDKQYLAALVFAAIFSWLAWLTVVLTIPPARLLTYIAFFVPFWTAVTTSGMLLAYGIDWRRGAIPSLRTGARRGALVSSVLSLNLAFAAAHKWSLLVPLTSVGVAVVCDYLADHRPNLF